MTIATLSLSLSTHLLHLSFNSPFFPLNLYVFSWLVLGYRSGACLNDSGLGDRPTEPFFFFLGGGHAGLHSFILFQPSTSHSHVSLFSFLLFLLGGGVLVTHLHFLFRRFVVGNGSIIIRWSFVAGGASLETSRMESLLDWSTSMFVRFFCFFFFVPFRPDILRTHPPSSTTLCADCLSLSLSLSPLCVQTKKEKEIERSHSPPFLDLSTTIYSILA